MRLLEAASLAFREFEREASMPKYAILSHTWGADEVVYKQMRKDLAGARLMKGFRKIDYCAKQALRDGIDFIWVDTCCIDKSSSAELSEAINSMYRWYQQADVCYTYLTDVDSPPSPNPTTKGTDSALMTWESDFILSRWFTRGWTLQELIAPKHMVFYSRDWAPIGSKMDLVVTLCDATKVPYGVLVNQDFSTMSVAQVMSWAAQRETSRPEDRAYCLMGLFGIHMPMLYGEGGERAFLRLQEEIIKTSDDMSIFAWREPEASFSDFRGLLARSPAQFDGCDEVRWVRDETNPAYQVTNKGIRIDLILEPVRADEYLAILTGVYRKPGKLAGIYLRNVDKDQYARVDPGLVVAHPSSPGDTDNRPRRCTIYVRQTMAVEQQDHSRAGGIRLCNDSSRVKLLDVQPPERWDAKAGFFRLDSTIASVPPPPAIFCLRSATIQNPYRFTITVDLTKPGVNVSGSTRNGRKVKTRSMRPTIGWPTQKASALRSQSSYSAVSAVRKPLF